MALAHPMSDFGRNLPVVQIRLLDTVLFQDCRVGGVSALLLSWVSSCIFLTVSCYHGLDVVPQFSPDPKCVRFARRFSAQCLQTLPFGSKKYGNWNVGD